VPGEGEGRHAVSDAATAAAASRPVMLRPVTR
jgi:hypothetical protein